MMLVVGFEWFGGRAVFQRHLILVEQVVQCSCIRSSLLPNPLLECFVWTSVDYRSCDVCCIRTNVQRVCIPAFGVCVYVCVLSYVRHSTQLDGVDSPNQSSQVRLSLIHLSQFMKQLLNRPCRTHARQIIKNTIIYDIIPCNNNKNLINKHKLRNLTRIHTNYKYIDLSDTPQ